MEITVYRADTLSCLAIFVKKPVADGDCFPVFDQTCLTHESSCFGTMKLSKKVLHMLSATVSRAELSIF